ncbi:MAG: methyl-accepting chemotaxis protein [Betaproteobacteria bacterium]|nr:methyl-accepting chemotaxis protein [Betaproteobacteria bacterium]
MKILLAPGIAVMGRLSNTKKLPLLSLAFTVPLLIVLYDTYDDIATPMLAAAAATWLLAGYLMFAFYFQADAGWAYFVALIKRVADGDLAASGDAKMGGYFGIVTRALAEVNRNLGQIVAQVRASADAVALSATEIASGNSNLSQRTEQQASTLEETASGMEELAGTVKQNADNCKLASGLAQSAEKVAKEGAEAVHGVVEGMGRIDQSSKRMADIIGVIEGIAFQTNILALNAAVEAARAGEQGRGFAVVAGEVRALAQRSAEAAKEIRALIEQSVSQIKDGSKKAEGAGKVIDDIVVSVQQVNQLIGEIAVASSEQSAGVGEINKAILQLESMTQQNAALVEEAAASSLTFQEQADRMKGLVARFKTGDQGVAPAAAAPQPRSAPGAARAEPLPRPTPKPLPRRKTPEPVGAEDEWKEF